MSSLSHSMRRMLRTTFVNIKEIPIFLSVSTFLLFAISLVSFVVGILSNDWQTGTVPISFLTFSIILPIMSMVVAFCVQIISIYLTFDQQMKRNEIVSTIISSIERASVNSPMSRIMLSYVTEHLKTVFDRLKIGTVVIEKDFWVINHHFYGLAYARVENTSLVPLEFWDRDHVGRNDTLLNYKDVQKSMLLDRGIVVTRTFLLTKQDICDIDKKRRLTKIVKEHLADGFSIYFIMIDDYPENVKQEIFIDLMIIDDICLSLARVYSQNTSVLTYDYYDLSAVRKYPQEYDHVWRLFENRNEFAQGEPPKLKYWHPTIRRRINEIPYMREPEFESERIVIEEMIAGLKDNLEH